jgi:ParB family transcriptional regulator, chromosome partitioning protein
VLIGENVRDDSALEAQFIASVHEHGVLQPITAIPRRARIETANHPGVHHRRADLRRPNASHSRIVTNDQRAALTDAQRAKGITQMLLSGTRRPSPPRFSGLRKLELASELCEVWLAPDGCPE